MVHKGLFMFMAFAAIALASEIEDAEQKKRGAGKANALNAIPSGAQKPDYSYNIYPQNSNPQSGFSQHYQSPVSNFYPLQSSSQYYTSSNAADASTSHSSQPSHSGQSHFVPINFVPNPGYHTKYQIVSPKAGNVLTVIPSPAIQPAHMLQYTNPFYSSNSNNYVASGSLLGPLGHGPFSFGSSFHPLSLSGSFIGQPSAMVMLPQPHGSIYNNLIYPSTASNLYNYYPSNSQGQAKYAYSPGPVQSIPAQANEYEKVQASQSISKDENGSLQNSDYISPSNVNSGYNGQNSYSKI